MKAIDGATSKFLRALLRRAKCCIYEETLGGNRHSFPLTQTFQRCWEAGCLSAKFCITGNDLLAGKVLVITVEVIQCRDLPIPSFCLIVFEASLFQSFILDLFLLLFLFLFYFFRSLPVFVLFLQFQALSPKLSFPSFPFLFELPFVSSLLHSPSLAPFYLFT